MFVIYLKESINAALKKVANFVRNFVGGCRLLCRLSVTLLDTAIFVAYYASNKNAFVKQTCLFKS